MEFAGRDFTPLVAPDPILVPEDFIEPVAGDRTCGVQSLHARFKVEVDEDFTKIEQYCFDLHS